MDFWNKRNIDSPPINSVRMRKNDSAVNHMKSVIDEALKILERKQMLHREGALLSRFIYKEKRKHHGHKILMSLEKIHRGLKRYLSVNFQDIYRKFSDLFSYVDGTDTCNEWIYVPTKQMLQHLLIQTQGFAKIMYHINNSCQIAAYYCREQCRHGHEVAYVMLSFSIISRIWYCSRYYTICACRWYSELLPYLQKMEIAGVPWLPEDYKFPSDLEAWLGPVPLTNELISCDVDVQQISEEVLESEKRDLGIPITRNEFSQLQEVQGQNINSSGGLARNVGYLTKYNKLLMTVSETCDLGELVARDQFNSSVLKDNVGECVGNAHPSVKRNIPSETILDTSLKSSSVIFNNEINCTEYSADGLADVGENIQKKVLSRNTNRQICPLEGRRLPSDEKKKLYKQREGTSKHNLLPRKHSVHFGKAEETSFIPDTRKEMLRDALPTAEDPCKVSKINFVASESDVCAQNVSQHITPCGHRKNKKVKEKKTAHLLTDSTARSTPKTDEIASTECNRDNSPLPNKMQTHKAKIMHEIKSVHDLKVFLGMEKKARLKGKNCATSNLDKSEWKSLIGAVNKILKKSNIMNTKGNRRQNIAAMQEIRNCILSFIT